MSPSGEAVGRGNLAGTRILVVDDEIIIALDLAQTLADEGADVVGPCTTLRDALAKVRTEHITAATLDVRLDDSTTEVVAELLASRHVPFLFYSGQELPESIRRRWPDCISLAKPVRSSEILAAVRSMIASQPPPDAS